MSVPQTPLRVAPGGWAYTPGPAKQPFNLGLGGSFGAGGPSPPPLQQNGLQTSRSAQDSLFPQTSTVNGSQPGYNTSEENVERAARTINATLDEEAKFPAFDNYVSQGYSSEYDIPKSVAWAPFQKIKTYDIPDRIFEQYNQAQVSTMMGLFAELNHAWISIDNALYLWDYTNPNPELIGFEEQPNSITAVKLVTPRAGVFVPEITRLLVVATTADVILIGVSCSTVAGGAKSVTLYQTRMHVPIRGISVQSIVGSAGTGRIFFAGRGNDDVYELTYQQEEKWFQNRCAKINHTTKGITSIVPALPFTQKAPTEFVEQLVIDDSRKLLYTLSSRSTLRVFSYKNENDLTQCLTRTLASILSDLGHKVPSTNLFGTQTTIASLNPISSNEASRISLMATTSNGCRIFFSTVSGGYYATEANTTSPPTSMQVHHVKFPPSDPSILPSAQPAQPNQNQITAFREPPSSDAARSLTRTRFSDRLPPGYFLCFVERDAQMTSDILFMSAPDAGRIAHPQDPSQANKFPEFGYWVQLEGRAEDVGEVSAPFGASGKPTGFGNELAVQFDRPVTEIAVLTNSGIHTFKRRRLVDIFAATVRYGGGDEGLEGEIKTFVRMYGRGETIATALAVACGQGSDVTIDSRVAKITDPEILERARKTFIDHGGKPILNENSIVDQGAPAIDNVRPSPRHEGLALYVSRLLRTVWNSLVLAKSMVGPEVRYGPVMPSAKLHDVQQDLTRLQEFLNTNRTFIEGLAGPEALNRVSTKQEEVALHGEHRALNSLLGLISNVIEGIAFVLVLLEEPITQIMQKLGPEDQEKILQMTYQQLFCTKQGKELAKELVKAIVNHSIDNGSKIETVTDALRRRCGSFCSPNDCDIFKAQEKIKQATDKNRPADTRRNILNESLRLLQRVAGSLATEQLTSVAIEYLRQEFYAGAIQVLLSAAQERDRGNSALTWLNEGSPGQDARVKAYNARAECYDLIHRVVGGVESARANVNDTPAGRTSETRINEAYEVVNTSTDELFQISLYDWYLSKGWSDRLLQIESPFVESYLQRKSEQDVSHADLLWKYYAHDRNYLEAANVQLKLAKSAFDLDLEQRIEYLSRARANASTKGVGMIELGRSRQSKQELIRETSDLLDIANIQGDILQRMRADARLTKERRPQVIRQLNGAILSVDELYNGYIDQAGYWDLCLMVYQIADHRNAADIRATWQNLIQSTHEETEQTGESMPYEVICEKVRILGARLQLSESTFSIAIVLPLLKRYAFEYQRNIGADTWVIDTFLDLSVPHESLVSVLADMFYADEPPFKGRNRRYVAIDIVRVVSRWFVESSQAGKERLLGGEETAVSVSLLLTDVEGSQGLGLSEAEAEELRVLRVRVDAVLRT